MNKKIFIFLNNKLLTIDLILPFMLELKNKQKYLDVEFISFDKTLNIIKKMNYSLMPLTKLEK